jgi:chromosome segregation protein
VRLKRLTVQGFKSFKDRTSIHFDDGITGIVGPNGCGKSNIVDALFWVMGEQSAKHLRGNTMKDVIFSGSSKYSPSTWAEVTLTLGNDEGKHIHIGNRVASPAEIQLTRKLYRNGETEYRINNEPCRLKDIQEVFMDTGAGAKSYSIIAQGEINRLVQAKPEERRVMIEEVAGITKFKLRKRESLKKIEATEQNLNRLTDLQLEIEKNLKALEKQAEKAERARTLKEKVQRHDLIVNSHKVFELLREFREAGHSIKVKLEEVESWTQQKESLELSLVEERIKKDDLTAQLDEHQREYNELSKKLAGAEERLNSLARTLTERERMIEQKHNDVRESQEEKDNREARLQELEAAFEALALEGEQEFDLGELQDRVALLRDDLDELDSTLKEKRRELELKQAELTRCDQSLFQNQSKQEEYSRTLQDLTQEIELSENQYSGVNGELKAERDQVHSLEQQVEKLNEQDLETKTSLRGLQEQKKTFESEHREVSRAKIVTESKLKSLEEMKNSLEGREEGVKAAIEAFGADKMQLIGSLLKCEEQYTGGVQRAMTEWLDTLVGIGLERDALIQWCRSQTESSLRLLLEDKIEMPTTGATSNEESFERMKLTFGESLQPVAELVTFESGSEHLKGLLDGYYLVSELNIAEAARKSDLNFKGVYTYDGKAGLEKKAGAIIAVLAQTQDEHGEIARNNQIEKLKIELSKQEQSVIEADQKLNEVLEQLQAQEQAYEELRSELLKVSSEYASKKSALESKMANFKTGQERLELLKGRKSEISTLRLTLMEAEETLQKEKDALRDSAENVQGEVEELAETRELRGDQYTELKEELVEKQVQAQSYEQRVSGVKSQMEDVRLQVERQEQRIATGLEQIEKFQSEIETMTTELEELEVSNQDLASVLEERECGLNDLKEVLSQLLLQMQERENQVKEFSQNINKNEKEMAALQAKVEQSRNEEEQVVRNVFEKYQIDLRDCLAKYLEFSQEDYSELHDLSQMVIIETENGPEEIQKQPYEFTRRYGQDLKDSDLKLRQYRAELSRLGDINWQAIEEYERQKVRFDFLRVQEAELKKSLENLQTAISHIDEKSRERFAIAFEEVDTRFRKVFPIIFGGGTAQLKIVGDINDPESGVEIIAQPPGKNMQSINLMSGGEKAMTAVSLIFSIFLVKPSPFCLLDEVDAPLDDANVGRFNKLLREMSRDSQFILITHNKKTMELNDTLYGVTMQEPGVSKAVSVQLH